jgi:hypothetical protein
VILAHLVAFGEVPPTPKASELDTVDLEAIALSHTWGLSNGHIERIPPSPCGRSDCGGSVLIWDGERRCILCARPGGCTRFRTTPCESLNGHGRRNASGTL